MAEKEDSKKIFDEITKSYGVVPNLFREMGEKSVPVLTTYVSGTSALTESSLGPKGLNAVMLAVSELNGCHYCTKAHSAFLKGEGLNEEEVVAISQGKPLKDERVNSLVSAARLIHGKKGWLEKDDIEGLEKKGIGRTEIYEIIAAIGLKTISNYINHINKTEIDPLFKP